MPQSHAYSPSPQPTSHPVLLVHVSHLIVFNCLLSPQGYGIVRPKLMFAEWVAVTVVSALYFAGGEWLPLFIVAYSDL